MKHNLHRMCRSSSLWNSSVLCRRPCHVECRTYSRISETFQPLIIAPPQTGTSSNKKAADETKLSLSQKLLTETGMIHPAKPAGTFHLLPLFLRSLDKLTKLIDEEMRAINCQKLVMPSINDAAVWKSSGRWQSFGNELIRFRDRQSKELCLAPTHEEYITTLLATTMHRPSYKRFPLRLYQMTTKFRDEGKPKHGVLRAREFLMKDLYTFDCSEEGAQRSYAMACQAYENLLRKLNLGFIKASGSSGSMGGSESHEYLLPCDTVGEDVVQICRHCSAAFNEEVLKSRSEANVSCPNCNGIEGFHSHKAIEVAHVFRLGTHYSKLFKATFVGADGKEQPLLMGCFGIGVTRLAASAVEVLSTEDEMRWPTSIAPYKLCVISPKAGSIEASVGTLPEKTCEILDQMVELENDVILDDRDLSIGRRLNDANKMGYPVVVVVGKEAMTTEPKFEVYSDYHPRNRQDLSFADLLTFLKGYFSIGNDEYSKLGASHGA